MLGLLISAGILGIIIAVMEDGDFPGWLPMIGCALAAGIPSALLSNVLPPQFFFVGLLAGALCGGLAISALCGMSLKRACIAAGIYFGISLAIQLVFYFLMR